MSTTVPIVPKPRRFSIRLPRPLWFGLAAVTVLFVAVANAAEPEKRAAGWPQWRGPNRDGCSSDVGLLQKWPDAGPPLAYTISELGLGRGGVAVASGKVVMTGYRKSDFAHVLAFDSDDGHELWATQVGSGSDMTPIIDGDRVYSLGVGGDLVCLHLSDGTVLWKKHYKRDFGNNVLFYFRAYHDALLIDGDNLICFPDGSAAKIVALDKLTGELKWKVAAPKPRELFTGEPAFVAFRGAGISQYVQMLGRKGGCRGISAEDGKLLWSHGREAARFVQPVVPIVRGDYVFSFSDDDGGAALLKLSRSEEGVVAEEVWSSMDIQFQMNRGGAILVGESIFGVVRSNRYRADGKAVPACINLMTGKTKWRGPKAGPGEGAAAAIYADRQLYFRYDDGVMALVEASHERYKLNGTFRIPTVTGLPDGRDPPTPPAISGGRLYIREKETLFVYDVRMEK